MTAPRFRDEYFNLPLGEDAVEGTKRKTYVLVIYDISDQRRRTRLAKALAGFGERVQESAFEAMLTKAQLRKLWDVVQRLTVSDDNVRLYRIRGEGVVSISGDGRLVDASEVRFV